MELKDVVGRNIRAERLRQGLSQEELAHRCGMVATELSRFERGVRDIRLSTLARLAGGLGIPAADLIRAVTDGRAGP